MRRLRLIFRIWNLFIGIGIVLVFIFFITYFVNFPPIFGTDPTKQILIAAIISTILALLISYFSIKADAQIQYFEDLESLLEEMQINYESICNFPKIVEERCVEWEKTAYGNGCPKNRRILIGEMGRIFI